MNHRVASLYHSLLKEANKFTNYNFRNHAIRKIKWDFQKDLTITDEKIIQERLEQGHKQLESLKRQVTLSQLYPEGPSVMDKPSSSSS